jgi:hypothetical protein
MPSETPYMDKWVSSSHHFSRLPIGLIIVNSIEKLKIAGDPLMPRCKGGISQKNDFNLFGSPIM